MKRFVDVIFVTDIPAFYKIKLYNEVSKKKKVFVIFLYEGSALRNKDFYNNEILFDYVILNKKNKFIQLISLNKEINSCKYNELVISGWNLLEFWFLALCKPKKKNLGVAESTIYESKTTGLKGCMKKLFLSRTKKMFVPGESNYQLIKSLGYKREIVKTKGVGLYNRIDTGIIDFSEKKDIRKFIYVGRLSPEKNLDFLIDYFNKKNDLELIIVGFGPLENELREKASSNIKFLGAVNNKELYKEYQKADVFVLASLSETWGVVVEEALNNGLPVLLSNRVGAAGELINNDDVGLSFDINDYSDFDKKIMLITRPDVYNVMRSNIQKIDFEGIETYQIDCYC